MSIDPFTGEFESRREAKLTTSRVKSNDGPDVYVHLMSADGKEMAVLSLLHMSHFVSDNGTRDSVLKWIGEMNNTKPPVLTPVAPTRFEREPVI
jgi:hypothetical protein